MILLIVVFGFCSAGGCLNPQPFAPPTWPLLSELIDDAISNRPFNTGGFFAISQ